MFIDLRKHRKSIITNVFIVGLLLLLYFLLPFHRAFTAFSNSNNSPYYKGNEAKPEIALECNVVWGTEYVPKLLDILKAKNIHITFFIGGSWANDNPDLLKKIVTDGHELGNHGYNHKMHSKLNEEQNRTQILDTENVIKQITGVRTVLFAPPSGDFNNNVVRIADSLGYKTILWSIDTIDWRREGKDIILKRVFKNPHNGAFILMHPTQYTVEALPEIIDGLEKKGYKITTVGELLK